jgi:hypothetical protein
MAQSQYVTTVAAGLRTTWNAHMMPLLNVGVQIKHQEHVNGWQGIFGMRLATVLVHLVVAESDHTMILAITVSVHHGCKLRNFQIKPPSKYLPCGLYLCLPSLHRPKLYTHLIITPHLTIFLTMMQNWHLLVTVDVLCPWYMGKTSRKDVNMTYGGRSWYLLVQTPSHNR